jgi:hypothetical protein
MLSRSTFLVSNTSASLQTTLGIDAHLAQGHFLHDEQIQSGTTSDVKQEREENWFQSWNQGETA